MGWEDSSSEGNSLRSWLTPLRKMLIVSLFWAGDIISQTEKLFFFGGGGHTSLSRLSPYQVFEESVLCHAYIWPHTHVYAWISPQIRGWTEESVAPTCLSSLSSREPPPPTQPHVFLEKWRVSLFEQHCNEEEKSRWTVSSVTFTDEPAHHSLIPVSGSNFISLSSSSYPDAPPLCRFTLTATDLSPESSHLSPRSHLTRTTSSLIIQDMKECDPFFSFSGFWLAGGNNADSSACFPFYFCLCFPEKMRLIRKREIRGRTEINTMFIITGKKTNLHTHANPIYY